MGRWAVVVVCVSSKRFDALWIGVRVTLRRWPWPTPATKARSRAQVARVARGKEWQLLRTQWNDRGKVGGVVLSLLGKVATYGDICTSCLQWQYRQYLTWEGP